MSQEVNDQADGAISVESCAPVATDTSSLPSPLSDLYRKEYEDLDQASLCRLVNDTFLSISVTNDQSKLNEKATQDQRNSPQWHTQQRG